jgi:hypothetical protein
LAALPFWGESIKGDPQWVALSFIHAFQFLFLCIAVFAYEL